MQELIRDIDYMWNIYREGRYIAVPLLIIGAFIYWAVLVMEATTGKRMKMGERQSMKRKLNE